MKKNNNNNVANSNWTQQGKPATVEEASDDKSTNEGQNPEQETNGISAHDK
jgi:hypothetical protein